MDILLSKSGSENPLWLSIACEELRVFGVFRQLREKIQSLADDLIQLEIQLLTRLEGESSRALIQGTLCLLEASASGLLETELRDILGSNRATLLPPSDSHSGSGTRSTSIDGSSSSQGRSTNLSSVSAQIEPLNAFDWAVVFRHLRPFLRPFGSSDEGRLDFYHRSFSKAVRRKYFTGPNGKTSVESYDWWHGKLAAYFACNGVAERRAEEYPYQLAASRQWSELSRALCDWQIFQQLYSDEHSGRLLHYWRQVAADFEGMGQAYATALRELRQSSDADIRQIADRYMQVVKVLAEGGRFSIASELLEQLHSLEVDVLGSRPEKMVDIYFLHAYVQDRILGLESYMYRSQLPRIKLVIENFAKSLALRRPICEEYGEDAAKHKRQLIRTLSRLAFYYSGWSLRGGDGELGAAEAQAEAIRYAEEAVQQARDAGDSALEGDALTTRGVAYGRACQEQIQAYQQAEELMLRTKGPLHHNLGRLYLNLAIHQEEVCAHYKAYDYFFKWHQLLNALYGPGHDQTKRAAQTLAEPMYRRIATERAGGVQVQALPPPSQSGPQSLRRTSLAAQARPSVETG